MAMARTRRRRHSELLCEKAFNREGREERPPSAPRKACVWALCQSDSSPGERTPTASSPPRHRGIEENEKLRKSAITNVKVPAQSRLQAASLQAELPFAAASFAASRTAKSTIL